MTIYLYTCRHSDPSDLAQTFEKVYSSLIYAGQEGVPKETELNYHSAIQGAKAPPEGYPPTQPLVITPPPLNPGNQYQS